MGLHHKTLQSWEWSRHPNIQAFRISNTHDQRRNFLKASKTTTTKRKKKKILKEVQENWQLGKKGKNIKITSDFSSSSPKVG